MLKLALTLFLQLANNPASNTIVPDAIVIHHTALTESDVRQFPGTVTISTINALHESRGYSVTCSGKVYHVGYHYLILPDGTVQQGRPENCTGAHTQGHNDAIGISLVGNFSSREVSRETPRTSVPTREQVQALARLIVDIRTRYKIPCERMYRHNDLNHRTRCPGDLFPWQDFQLLIGCGSAN